jgi:hypothetical protein
MCLALLRQVFSKLLEPGDLIKGTLTRIPGAHARVVWYVLTLEACKVNQRDVFVCLILQQRVKRLALLSKFLFNMLHLPALVALTVGVDCVLRDWRVEVFVVAVDCLMFL